MQIQPVNNLSLTKFSGQSTRNTKRPDTFEQSQDYTTDRAPVSKRTADALRKAFIAGMMAAGVVGGMTSCVEIEPWKSEGSWAWAYADCDSCNKPDTIFVTTPLNDVNFAINDSIINQFLNIGSEIDGPMPGENVILVSGTFRNRYDNKVVDFQIDSAGTNKDQSVYVAKLTDLYDPENPKKQWIRTIAKDVPGKGIKYEFYTANSEEKPEQWQYNQAYSVIVANGARSNNAGVNTIYDKDGNMIWKGTLTKGQLAGAFTCGLLALDENGEPYIDPDTGEPEMIDYDYDNTKIWTRKLERQHIDTSDPRLEDF